MTLPATEQLDQLSHADLVALVKALIAENAALRAELDQLRPPPANSRNSSQPPSRDQKSNLPARQKKKFGPPFGHQRCTRPLVEHPTQVITLPVRHCVRCQADLSQVVPRRIERRQVTELPPLKPVVIETRQHQVVCPHCQQLNRGSLPPGLEAERCFGPRLEAMVVYLKHQQHLSYARTVETLRDLCGLNLSEGGVGAILERAGQLAAPVAEQLKAQVITSPVIKSDETSARVAGRNHWQWVFIGTEAVYHYLAASRSAEVIHTVMGELEAEVWVCDCFSAQLKAPAKVFQLCLQHQLRDLQRVLDQTPQEGWAAAVQKLLREAIHLKHRFDCPQPALTLAGYLRRVTGLENKLDALLEQEVSAEAARKLQARFTRHRDKLLVFLYDPDVPPTNNECERALRTSVVHRKVINGFRSQWGAEAYAALQSIIATAKHKGEEVFQSLVALMGPPLLHFLEASGP
jgi:transposase